MCITKIVALLVITALMTGCVPSLNPLYTKDDPIFDPALVGTWTNNDGEQWVFSKSGDKSYELVVKPKEGAAAVFQAHLVQFGSLRFLDLRAEKLDVEEKLVKNDFYWFHAIAAHSIWKIELDEDAFRLAGLDGEWLEKSLKKKKVKIAFATTGGGDDAQMVLTAPTRQLQAFVVRYAGEAFDDPREFQRHN